jgi:putative transposase
MRDRLFVHVVWTTRDRSRLIDAKVARFLERFLAAVAHQERARILEIGLVRTHLHLLVRLHPTTAIPRLLQRLKGGSAVIANREGHAGPRELKWAKGYDIESVSARSVDRLRAYIRDQPRHHPDEAIPDWRPDAGAVAMSDR